MATTAADGDRDPKHVLPQPQTSDESTFVPEEYDGEGDDDFDDDDDEEDDDEYEPPAVGAAAEHDRLLSLLRRIAPSTARLRVHDLVVRGNARTRGELIEAEVAELLRGADTVQELVGAAEAAAARLRRLGVFDAVSITLDAGPTGLPGTADVVVEVVEAASPLAGNFGLFAEREARSLSMEASVKLKNLFGYGDIWDASGTKWLDRTEIGFGVFLPRFKAIPTPLTARMSLLSQDWLALSSFKDPLLGLSLGLYSTINHNLSCNLTWRKPAEPSQTSSDSAYRQLGQNLISALKYTYKIDQRDSHLRPNQGYAFLSSSEVGGLSDSKGGRFFRQEFDVRGALPLGLCNAALNIGVAAAAAVPLGNGLAGSQSPLPELFFITRHQCSGALSLPVFQKSRLREPEQQHSNDPAGGELAVAAIADLSFDLPVKMLQDTGIHAHAFMVADNMAKLPAIGDFRNFLVPNFLSTFRTSAGIGIVLPTKFLRLEVNYCHILKRSEHDSARSGIQVSFSSPV